MSMLTRTGSLLEKQSVVKRTTSSGFASMRFGKIKSVNPNLNVLKATQKLVEFLSTKPLTVNSTFLFSNQKTFFLRRTFCRYFHTNQCYSYLFSNKISRKIMGNTLEGQLLIQTIQAVQYRNLIIQNLLHTIATSNNGRNVNPSTSNVPSSNRERIFTSPKNVLHNIYDIIAKELKNRDLKVQPTYVKEKKNNAWNCSYNIKWPENLSFTAVASTKRDASHKAATSALMWLRQNKKITEDGHPIILGKSEIKEIVKQKKPFLNLDDQTLNYLQNIADTYKNEFIPTLTNCVSSKNENSDINRDSETEVARTVTKKVFNQTKYLAKEKITLPISKYKEKFIEMLRENRVIIINGEPGCGKSTRIPQYVLEAWAKDGLKQNECCQIAVTQPRRIAAISLADRVSDERDERCGHIVGYQVRLKSNYNPSAGRIFYCTTGILLRYLQSDINMSSFSHVILDEAHERDVNTDLLITLMKSALEANPNLKLIVMSATADIDLFRNFFNNPPVLHIPGFTYPVTNYFLDDLKQVDLVKSKNMCSNNNEIISVVHEDVVKLINYLHKNKKEGAILCFLPGWEDISKVDKLLSPSNDMSVLCLHSRLQDSDQRKIFNRTPPGVRKVILSTNIAETSITIDDVVYVIDTGIHKENRFDNERGVTCIDNYWISQSSMIQRKGRAGRVQPGESFHLYTKSKYDSFTKNTLPEILKTSLTKIVLSCKAYSNNMDAIEFMRQLPSPPDKNAIRRAVLELKELQLLDDNENLTPLGKKIANFQMEPKLAKVLVNSVVYKCVTPVVDIVTIFSAETELFSGGLTDKRNIQKVKCQGCTHSDHLAMMRLFEAWLELMEDYDERTAERYCADANLVHHKLITINKLRKLHFDYLHNNLHGTLPIVDKNSDNDELVKAILFSGAGNILRHRNWDIVKGRYKSGNVFLTNFNQKATITSDSVNFKKTSFPSEFLVYFNEIRSNIRRTSFIRECSVIAPIAIMLFSNKNLIIKEIEGESDRVNLSLKDSHIEVCCSNRDAQHIQKCKEALDCMYQYFIFQMTAGGEYNSKINEIWDKILEYINLILLKHRIK